MKTLFAVLAVCGLALTTAAQADVLVSFDTPRIAMHGYTTVNWSATGARDCVDQSGASVQPHGKKRLAWLTESTKVAITCVGDDGQKQRGEARVEVVPYLGAEIAVEGLVKGKRLPSGQAVTLSWSSLYAESCEVKALDAKGLSGVYKSAPLTATTTFTLECKNLSGTASKAVTVEVQAAGIRSAAAGAERPSGQERAAHDRRGS